MTDFTILILRARRQVKRYLQISERNFQTGIPILPNHESNMSVDKGFLRHGKHHTYLSYMLSWESMNTANVRKETKEDYYLGNRESNRRKEKGIPRNAWVTAVSYTWMAAGSQKSNKDISRKTHRANQYWEVLTN